MRGLNHRIIGALSQGMSKAAGPSTSSNLLNSILDFAQMPFAASWIHTSARQSSQIPSLRHALLSPPPARLSPAAGRFAIPRTFATTAVAPKGGIRPGSERSGWARYFLLVPPMIAACLGKWQLDRRQWKTDLLERRQRIMKGEPLDIFSDSMPDPEEYQRVRATGKFDYSRTQYVGPRPRSRMGTTEIGFLAVTPLVENIPETSKNSKNSRSSSAGTPQPRQIMVLRGWVPNSWRQDPSTRTADGEPSGLVTIEGVVRRGEDPGTFVPDNKPEEGAWYYISSTELATAAGLPEGTPMVEVISPEVDVKMLDGGPTVMDVLGGRGKLPSAPIENYPLSKSEGDMGAFSVMPRDHLNYAATWFTLMTATGLMAVQALRKKRR